MSENSISGSSWVGDVKGVVMPENREEGWSTVITSHEIDDVFRSIAI
jgi:hypothetical protein